MKEWKKSRFNVRSMSKSGEVILYNSLSGAIGIVPQKERGIADSLLKKGVLSEEVVSKTPLANDLIANGYFITSDTDEFQKAAELHHNYFNNEKALQLIIMPTEECNFRCVYCYESFLRGTMAEDIVEGVKKLIDQKINGLDNLFISWFGGEPTEALEVIYDISEHAMQRSREHGVQYSAGITSNGYNITPNVFQKLIECEVRSYQITVDGSITDHDKRRIKMDGGSTYTNIMSNLTSMSKTDEEFKVVLRVNFDPESYVNMDQFIEDIKDRLNGDQRFFPDFHTIGKWGGDNDDNLLICSERDGAQKRYELFEKAIDLGHDLTLRETLAPGGSVCYAAKPWSIVIGSDGTLYKCTVALEDERNKVGRLLVDGSLDINQERFDLWVTSNETIDEGCQKCFFRPSCQGASCPLVRLNTGEQPCPTDKKHIKKVLTTISGVS
ncbi:radical SAM/SPASM domain-containing protein [Bacillus sp. V3-13]|uniref:radical SAM/SPASM domain-containing protein n=1 Tax=Bacillus sp. V3-13 TaxID=2053728 RepID=UPI000C76ECE6|nr:radical SAM protein [Bacillus sp. V3-13]PLR77947.1 radical SAM/SPASM domain-containing protein [Bacillus sp. V3-13]